MFSEKVDQVITAATSEELEDGDTVMKLLCSDAMEYTITSRSGNDVVIYVNKIPEV